MKLILICLLFIVFSTSCGVVIKEDNTEERIKLYLGPEDLSEPVSNITQVENIETNSNYTLLIETRDIKKGSYEPESGCYIGANISLDKRINADVTTFESLSEKSHAIYTQSMALGGEYPENWILECIAARKTPNLIITPADENDPYQEELILKTALDIGKFDIPIFVHFYPYPKTMGYKASDYKTFYKKMWQALRDHAPNAAMVWTVSAKDVSDCSRYYPGHLFTDWVGIGVNIDISADGGHEDLWPQIDEFYAQYQKSKPIIISELAVSHFSTIDNKYYIEQCADVLTSFYEKIESLYPRIKAVIYANYNNLIKNVGIKKNGYFNNYIITDDNIISNAYAKAISSETFLSSVYSNADNNKGELIKSPSMALNIDGDFYISEKSLSLCGISTEQLKPTTINGENYFPISLLSDLGADFHVDHEHRILYLNFN